jgi:hypothetical protein
MAYILSIPGTLLAINAKVPTMFHYAVPVLFKKKNQKH